MFRPITISAVLNGWIVQCGCQTLVFHDRDTLVRELDAYLRDPVGTEKRVLGDSINASHMGGAIEAAPPTTPPPNALRAMDERAEAGPRPVPVGNQGGAVGGYDHQTRR